MEPMAAALAVIALATAVKDIVELGQKIHESFARASKNYHNAERVAKNIKDMVEQIKVFCDDHKDALDNMNDFLSALKGLLHKFQSFEAAILPLLPPVGGWKRDFLIRSWREWRASSEVERSILDLQSDIVTVMRTHMMKSAMRTEVKQETNHQEMRRGLADAHHDITQGLEVLDVVRRDVSAIRTITATTMTHRSYESSGTTSDELIRNIIMFAQSTPSTSVPMLRTPNVITEELMTTAYIKLQIDCIAMTVERMSTLPASALGSVASNNITPFQLAAMLEQGSMSIAHLRRTVVREVTNIRDVLDIAHFHTISIDDGANALNILSVGLERLGMGKEAILVGQWAITLARLLVAASDDGQPDLTANLVLCLLNQSKKCHHKGNKIQSLQAIEEAYTIAQSLLWNQYQGESDFQVLYSDILLQYAGLLENNQQSIEMCIEAVHLLEEILNVQAYTQSNLPGQIQDVVHHSSSFVDSLFSSAPPKTAISSYAEALYALGTYLSVDGHPESALALQLLAIAVHRKMVSIHGHEHKVALAWALSLLVRGRTASHVPTEELIDMADECIQLYRELADKNPLYYARSLVDVLWVKANTLQSLDRDAEAVATWEEITSLAEQIIQDSALCADALVNLSNQFRRLKRHDDAVRTRRLAITAYQDRAENQAATYFYLSKDLQELRQYKESADAARKSVALYQCLAMRDPKIWMGNLAQGLSDLAHCLAASGDYSEAHIAWKESLSMLDNFLNSNPDESSAGIDLYLSTLLRHTWILYALEDKEECLKVSFTAAQHLRQMSEIYPQNRDVILQLLLAEYTYAYTMLRVGCPRNAQEYVDHWLDIWSSKPSEAILQSATGTWYAVMLNLKANILDAQGCTEQALLATQKVHGVVSPHVSTHQFAFDAMIKSMVQEAQLQVDLGASQEALRVAERALQLSRDNKPKLLVNSLLWSLHGVASTTLSCQNYHRAVEAAREGCGILASPEGLEYVQDDEYRSFLRPSLFAIMSAAEANLGRCGTAVEYAHRAVDASLEVREMKLFVSAMTAEQSYMETRSNLADILLATGDLKQARQICEERRVYFSKRIEKRTGDYRELAPILRMLGILCCSEGHHEDGAAAAKELSRIMKTLGSAFPSLQEQVKIRLRRQAKVPILKVLDEMSDKLDCEHQAGVVSLFEI